MAGTARLARVTTTMATRMLTTMPTTTAGAIITTATGIGDAMRDGLPNVDADAVSPATELVVWLSPSFPVGGFAYSQGLEFAVADGAVVDAASLSDWLSALTRQGALWNDLVLIASVVRAANADEIGELAELSLAMQPSRERADEARVQGQAFMAAFEAGWAAGARRPDPDAMRCRGSLAVSLGIASRLYDLAPNVVLPAYASAFQANLVSAAIRLSVVGQFDGQRVLAGLMPLNTDVCGKAVMCGVHDLGGATFGADLASLFHETQNTRLFRS